LSGKLPADLVRSVAATVLVYRVSLYGLTLTQTCPIPRDPFPTAKNIRFLRRANLILDDPSQNHRLASLSTAYDLLSVRPTTEKALLQACSTLDVDIISLDLSVRHPYHFKHKTLAVAIARGVRFEICYAPSIIHSDATARRNLISNATQLIRATRGRGIVISSEAEKALGLRAPFDVINLGAVWGLAQDKGREAVDREARAVVAMAKMKRTSFRGVIAIIDGGEACVKKSESSKAPVKRKAGAISTENSSGTAETPPLSKRQQKKKAKQDAAKVPITAEP
jgi:ribonuclease P/MRP protein subunit RPP1